MVSQFLMRGKDVSIKPAIVCDVTMRTKTVNEWKLVKREALHSRMPAHLSTAVTVVRSAAKALINNKTILQTVQAPAQTNKLSSSAVNTANKVLFMSPYNTTVSWSNSHGEATCTHAPSRTIQHHLLLSSRNQPASPSLTYTYTKAIHLVLPQQLWVWMSL